MLRPNNIKYVLSNHITPALLLHSRQVKKILIKRQQRRKTHQGNQNNEPQREFIKKCREIREVNENIHTAIRKDLRKYNILLQKWIATNC